MVGVIHAAHEKKVDLVVFPELATTGYPPEDLLLKPQFIQDNLNALDRVAQKCHGITAVVGFVDRKEDLYNAAAVIHCGEVRLVYHKQALPNYGVFDENRYFQAGRQTPVFTLNGVVIGVNICEDIWSPDGPTRAQVQGGGAEIIVNISASPFYVGKGRLREEMLATRAKDNTAIMAYVNMVGGQDELVFDGASLIFNADGTLISRGKAFEEDLLMADLSVEALARTRLRDPARRKEKINKLFPEIVPLILSDKPSVIRREKVASHQMPILPPEQEIYRALTLGLLDYVHKNGFKMGVIGLSGGIDSALTAVIAVDAIGAQNVVGVFMPSRYTSVESHEDTHALAAHLGIRLITLSIESPLNAYLSLLDDPMSGATGGVTEENLQSRIRGNLLMALSNKFGWLVLTTGNKSEMSVGYATLYGDMAGGFAVIKDIWKEWVYRLAMFRNDQGTPIPERVFHRAPTAELRPNQTDQDTLPPYDVLDPILQAYVEEDKGFEEITAAGFEPATVAQVISMVDLSEYKRRQAPVGVKISPRALGKDWRMPITNRYRSFYQTRKGFDNATTVTLSDTTKKEKI